MATVAIAFIARLLAGLATGIGTLAIILTRHFSERLQTILRGFGKGVMLAATDFSLIVPGTEAATRLGLFQAAALVMCLRILCGAAATWLVHNQFPHEHFFKGQEGPD